MHADQWIGLKPIVEGQTRFTLTSELVRFDGKLFGGTGLAVTVAAMEQLSNRSAIWATVQFVGTADQDDEMEVTAEELATGGTTSQIRVTATFRDRLVLAGLGSTARVRDDSFAARFGTMPDVTPPEDCETLKFGGFEPPPEIQKRGPFSAAEFRLASQNDEASYIWTRLRRWPQSRATLAYLADFVPSAVLAAAGRFGGGISLDNSIRFGPPVPPDTEWVLVDNEPYFADNGFVHGSAKLWSREGLLLGVASQSAIATIFDLD